MRSTELPLQIGDQLLLRARCAAVRETLRPLTASMAFLFGVLFVASFAIGFGELTWPIAAGEFVSAVTMIAIFVAVSRVHIADLFVHPVVGLIGMIALARCTAQLYVWGSPRDTTNFAVLLAAIGLVSLSMPLSILFAALTWTCWLSIACLVHPHVGWTHYSFFLLWATVLAGVVQVVRLRALRRLLQADARHQLLVESLPVVSYIDEARAGGRPLYISPQVEQMLGYSPAEWLSRPDFWIDCLYEHDRQRALETIREHIKSQNPWDLEYRMVAKNGRIVWLQDRSTRGIATESGRPLAYGILVDITERKRAEAQRDGANRVFERLAAGAPLEEVLEVLVAAAEEIQPGMLGSVLLLDDQGRLRHAAAPSLPEFYCKAIDGVSIGPTVGSCGAAAWLGKHVIVDDIATHPNWAPYRDLALRAGLRACWSQPIFSSAGQVIGTLAMYYRQPRVPQRLDMQLIQTASNLAGLAIERSRTAADVAGYREHLEELVAERSRQLQLSLDQLRHSERLSSIGTLAAGIAHEINNPVGMILLSAEQVLCHIPDADKEGQPGHLMREIVENAKRCGQIVKSVLRFARQEPGKHWPADVNTVIEHAVDLTRTYVLKRGGVIETSLQPDLPSVLLNPVELEQVFVNLIRNGVESTDMAPRILIESTLVGSTVHVSVCDNGRGVRPEDRSRIFDPFYTTRQSEGGTGLGLSLTYGIVTDHGGTIRIEDASGGGTIMRVELPVNAADVPHAAENGEGLQGAAVSRATT
jgi:PAS domain S-box-containing protein